MSKFTSQIVLAIALSIFLILTLYLVLTYVIILSFHSLQAKLDLQLNSSIIQVIIGHYNI